MMKLHILQGACSLVPHIALVMAKHSDNIHYDIISVSRENLKSPAFLAINPQGSVPVLQDGEFSLSQNLAILSYLDKQFPNAKIFGTGDNQKLAKTQYWLSFLNADLHKSFAPIFNPARVVADESAYPLVIQQATTNFLNLLAIPNQQLENQDFLNGEFTVADMYLYAILRWATAKQVDFSQYTNIAKFIKTVEQNKFVLQTLEEEDLQTL